MPARGQAGLGGMMQGGIPFMGMGNQRVKAYSTPEEDVYYEVREIRKKKHGCLKRLGRGIKRMWYRATGRGFML